MRFTYQAPVEYNDLTSGLRTVESRYQGPHDFKVYVDKVTRLVTHGVEYDHDGHPGLHAGDPETLHEGCEMHYLHSHNPNHICLMAMITNHEEHEAPNVVEVVCEKYNMVYQRHEPMDLFHTFDFQKCTIDERGVVTYAWWKMDISWEMLVSQGISHRGVIQERMKGYMSAERMQKAQYCIEIIDYVLSNEISKKHPWKVAWPDIDTVSLDNSIPIGLGSGTQKNEDWLAIELQPYYQTTYWGSTPHEKADRPVGSGLLRSKNPMSPSEAALVEGALVYQESLSYCWCDERLTDAHPSHCHRVDEHDIIRQQLIDSNPDIQLTAHLIRTAHEHHCKVCEENGDPVHRKSIPSDDSSHTH
jgi:hypothetical protein